MRAGLFYTGPLTLLAIRYLLGTLVLIAFFFNRLKYFTKEELNSGLILGGFLAIGNICQTMGLKTTNSGKAGFITGLYIVFVPFLARYWLKQRLRWFHLLGTLIATLGLALLSIDRSFRLQIGDLWLVSCAVVFTGHVVGVAALSKGRDIFRVTMVQLGVVAVLSLLLAPCFEPTPSALPYRFWGLVIYMALVPTALTFTVHFWVQPKTSAVRAALIMSTEAIIAAVLGWWWSGESMSGQEMMGCTLMFLGIIVVEAVDKFPPQTQAREWWPNLQILKKVSDSFGTDDSPGR